MQRTCYISLIKSVIFNYHILHFIFPPHRISPKCLYKLFFNQSYLINQKNAEKSGKFILLSHLNEPYIIYCFLLLPFITNKTSTRFFFPYYK